MRGIHDGIPMSTTGRPGCSSISRAAIGKASGPARAARARRGAVFGTGALAAFVVVAFAKSAGASNPLEYPDNGSAAFSRGGAWLAVANEPIAAHYNPAGLATQATALSVEQLLVFPKTCFDRRGRNGAAAGPDDASVLPNGTPLYIYENTCSVKSGFPNTIPSISFAWRASPRLGVGVALVPPATYGVAKNQFPILAEGIDNQTHSAQPLPAPYRYMQLGQDSLVLFPTVSVGYEVFKHFRVGVGFISGIGVINFSTVGVSNLNGVDAKGDHMADDSLSTLHAKDLFVPGAIFSILWSPAPILDVALWGRWIDSIRADSGDVDVSLQTFNGNGELNPPCAGATGCTSNQSVLNHLPGTLTHFEYPIPPEIRIGTRFHEPRSDARVLFDSDAPARDPLHDDVFDVEADASYTFNSVADVIQVRFPEKSGDGAVLVNPTKVPLPPNADRPTGYIDSVGVRLGGQWNAIRDVLGARLGGWIETRSQDPAFLTVSPIGALRWGFGGGVVVRDGFFDISAGYQRQMSAGLDNGGNGRLLAPAGTTGVPPPFNLGREPPNVSAADRTQFRTIHAINGGSVTFDAHVFTLGGLVRF